MPNISNNGIEKLLASLDKVRKTGSDSWLACCPAHKDKSPSLAINYTSDGVVLIHCFAGCNSKEVLSAVGMSFEELYPPRTAHAVKGKRRPIPAADILRAIQFEALIVVVAGRMILTGDFNESDQKRTVLAMDRINRALEAGGIRHV